MPSPFPGIDPFLEAPAYWSDFHSRFVNYWCEAIADALPDSYEAGIGERVYLIENEPDARKLVFPDVAITDGEGSGQRTRASGVATLDPVVVADVVELDSPDRLLGCFAETLDEGAGMGVASQIGLGIGDR